MFIFVVNPMKVEANNGKFTSSEITTTKSRVLRT